MSERQRKKLALKEANKAKRRMIEKVLSSSKTRNSAFNLNLLVDGWLELESDPGTFSLLIEDFGCYGAQVDEIYDLEQKIEEPVLGFIFLFKWLNNQQNVSSRSLKSSSVLMSNSSDHNGQLSEQNQWSYVDDENFLSEIFFAKQMISNSCATHALISILLNCDYGELNLGPTLTRLKEHTKIMNPENKGYAISNLPELAKAHNSHASYSSLYNKNKTNSHSGMSYIISGNQRTNLQQNNHHDAYHFVSYVPIKGRLYELDGLKNYPIDHGPIGSDEKWTEKFRRVIKQRLLADKSGNDSSVSSDIRYNLMAVVPDKRVFLRSKLRQLKSHQKIVSENIKRLANRTCSPKPVEADIPNPPYSPLSNGTLTASEAGSANNSPRHLEESFFSDDENQVDRYVIVKFNKNSETSVASSNGVEPAHKNCIIKVDPIDASPLDLKIVPSDEIQDKNESNQTKLNRNKAPAVNESSIEGADSKLDDSDVKMEINSEQEETESPPSQLKQVTSNSSQGAQEHKITTSHQNGVSSDDDSQHTNETPAHNNEKYNLSRMPPFDFNIIDEMQHVHFEKSTLRELKSLSVKLSSEIDKLQSALKEEMEKRKKFKIDNSRRTHNYEPFIMTFLSLLAKQGNLADLIEKDLGIVPEEPSDNRTSDFSICKTPKLTTNAATKKYLAANGGTNSLTKTNSVAPKPKPKYKYVSTGRPVGRPRKHPLVPPPVKTNDIAK